MENHGFRQAFGPHLIIDGYGCRPELLSDAELVRRFLDETPAAIGMTKISPPVVMKTDEGVSGFVIIAESHISLHTWVQKKEIRIDLFSCKVFNQRLVVNLSCAAFDFSLANVKLLERGLEFPRNKAAVAAFLLDERDGEKNRA